MSIIRGSIRYEQFVLPMDVTTRLEKTFATRNEDEKVLGKFENALRKEQKLLFKNFRNKAKKEYDEIFGTGAFDLLEKAGYPNPAEAMAYGVDLFWSLPCSRFIPGSDDTLVEFLPDDRRLQLLIDTLATIADKAFKSLDEHNRPKRVDAEKIAESFLRDLIYPTEQEPVNKLVEEQLQAYKGTKPVARKADGLHLCPICNCPFTGGTNARADFLNNPESHTNRAPSHGNPGYIVICDTCKFERYLQQQILEGKAAQIMVLMPHMNIGYRSGELFRNKVLQIWEQASAIMSVDNPDPQQRFSFSLTGEIARRLHLQGSEIVTPEDLVQAFTYKTGLDKLKDYRRQLKTFLNENIGEGLSEWNEYFDTDFQSEEEFLLGVENLSIPDPSGVLREIRGKAFKLTPQMRIVCETPHLILVPIRNPIAIEKDSEVNAAIRELFSMLVIGLTLDCSVAMIRDGEDFSFTGGEGIVRIPSVSALRKLIGYEWLDLEGALKWIQAIAAAAQIAYAVDYPERSNLYQILSSPSPGHILRRIEMKLKGGYVPPVYFSLLEKIKEVLS